MCQQFCFNIVGKSGIADCYSYASILFIKLIFPLRSTHLQRAMGQRRARTLIGLIPQDNLTILPLFSIVKNQFRWSDRGLFSGARSDLHASSLANNNLLILISKERRCRLSKVIIIICYSIRLFVLSQLSVRVTILGNEEEPKSG